MAKLKYWFFALAFFTSACATTSPTPLPISPSATETLIPPTSTPEYIIVMQVVTPTPEIPLAQECFNTAVTQMDLNNCAAAEIDLAEAELDKVIAQINFSPEEKTAFDKLQSDWEAQVENDCKFFYGQLITESDGTLHYKGGSMAPMQRGLCIASQYKRRIQDLKDAYLNS